MNLSLITKKVSNATQNTPSPALFLATILLFAVVLTSIHLTENYSFLAYPPPPTWTAENGYPGLDLAAPTSTLTMTQANGYDSEATATLWPTPTSYNVTPALTPRQGVAGGQQYYLDRYKFGSWGWHWSYFLPSGYPSITEHVPMLVWRPWGVLDDRLVMVTTTPGTPVGVTRTPVPTPLPSYISYAATQTPHNYWLIFNECEHQLQCWTSPEDAATSYRDFLVPFIVNYILPIEADPKLIVGGINAHECGIDWLRRFITAYRDINNGNNPPQAGISICILNWFHGIGLSMG